MSTRTSFEERVKIVTLAEAGFTDQQIGQRMGWSPHTVRKWCRRGAQGGRASLASKMGRPATGALSTFPAEIQDRVRQMRLQHPGWGPKTLVAELKRDLGLAGQRLPSRASIARLIQEEGLSRVYERHTQLPDTNRVKAGSPHAVWEMDARGYSKVPDVGVISLINLNDRFSRARLFSFPCVVGKTRWQRHPNTEDYQAALRLAFVDWGLPERLQVDRESVFHDNQTKSPYPTRLHQWLLALGVSLHFGRPRQPQDQAVTERSHQLWAAQALEGQRYDDWQQLYYFLRQRRDFLNCHLPCATLGEQPPLQAYPEAMHSGRPYRPEREMQMLDLSRVHAYLAQGRWFRLVSKDGTFSLGGHIYHVGVRWARQQVEITFDPVSQSVVCLDQSGCETVRRPVRGLTKEDLMGELAKGINLPLFQLCLPFDWEALKVIRLSETLVT
jgi:transposase